MLPPEYPAAYLLVKDGRGTNTSAHAASYLALYPAANATLALVVVADTNPRLLKSVVVGRPCVPLVQLMMQARVCDPSPSSSDFVTRLSPRAPLIVTGHGLISRSPGVQNWIDL